MKLNKDEDEELTKVYNALGHPARKRIVELLGKKQQAGFKDLKKALGVSVGTLYFHLETLDDLVAQNKDRKYFLTDKGKGAFKLIASGDKNIAAGSIIAKEGSSFWSRLVKDVVFGRFLLIKVNSSPKRFTPEILIVLGFGAWLFASNGVEPIMMFYNNHPTWQSPIILAVEFVANWLLVFALLELFSYAFHRRKGGEVPLLFGTLFSLIPFLIPLSILHLNKTIALGWRIDWLWINVLLLALQAWVLCLLTANLSLAKGIRIEKAALVTMVIMYFNIAFFALLYVV